MKVHPESGQRGIDMLNSSRANDSLHASKLFTGDDSEQICMGSMFL